MTDSTTSRKQYLFESIKDLQRVKCGMEQLLATRSRKFERLEYEVAVLRGNIERLSKIEKDHIDEWAKLP